MVISWILNSLHKNIADSVLFLQSASAIWIELNQRFEQTSGALIYQIQQKLYSISQSSDDFQTYYTKLMKIWDEIRMVQDFPECSCSTAGKINKFLEDQRLIQLLMGLNDSYKILKGHILMMKPLPSLSTACALITQEEHQREINIPSVINHDDIAMNVSANQHNSFSKRTLTCNHCKKPGHTKAQCYRLVGFPATFKFTRGNRDDHQSTVHNVVVVPNTTSSSNITTEQYQQLLQMFNNHQSSSSGSTSHVNASMSNGAMNPEGPLIEE